MAAIFVGIAEAAGAPVLGPSGLFGAAIAEASGFLSIGGLVGLLFVGGAASYFLNQADGTVPPAHAPHDDDMYPCPEWLPTKGQFNWGVVGETLSGKSTLINAMRGVRTWEKDKGAAPVHLVEGDESVQPESYQFHVDESLRKLQPNLEKIMIWDLPTFGTGAFPAGTYVKQMGLRHFDGILLLTDGRFFKDDDVMLMHTLQADEVPIFMVRNKVDIDVEQNEEQKDVCPEDTVKTLRRSMEDKHQGIAENLYLVSAAKALRTKKGVQMKLDFDQLVEDLVYKTSKGRTVLPAPCYWNDRALEGNLVRRAVSEDFKDIVRKILLNMDHCRMLQQMKIVSLTRVENPMLYKRYFRTKDRIIEERRKARQPLPVPPLNPPVSSDTTIDNFVNEVWCWHGTKSCNLELILTEGFDERVANRDQNLYGSGTYFSTEPCKAMQYTDSDASDSRFLLICRLVLGQPYYPTGSLDAKVRRPPCTRGCSSQVTCKHPRADSVVANPGISNYGKQTHREMVVYYRGQSYPEFVVEISK